MSSSISDSAAQESAAAPRDPLRRAPLYLLGGLVVIGALLAPYPQLLLLWFGSEWGVVETLTFALALVGAGLGLQLFIRRNSLPAPMLLGAWFALIAIGLVLFAGEEISWGQHWLGFASPEMFARNNLQHETNLHNMSLATERLPKLALNLVVLIGGLIWPAYVSLKKRAPLLNGWFGWIWPDARLWHAAAISMLLRIPERTLVWNNIEDGALRGLYTGIKESTELFGVLFIVITLAAALRRLKAQ